MIHFRDKQYQCEMEVTMDIIGGKWKVLIIWHLANHQVMRFSELNRLHPKLTQKMLTQQLRELEQDGVIHRKVYTQVPPKVEYSLTDSGKSLEPILKMMCEWARQYVKAEKTEATLSPT